jgi:hypothetical protein
MKKPADNVFSTQARTGSFNQPTLHPSPLSLFSRTVILEASAFVSCFNCRFFRARVTTSSPAAAVPHYLIRKNENTFFSSWQEAFNEEDCCRDARCA